MTRTLSTFWRVAKWIMAGAIMFAVVSVGLIYWLAQGSTPDYARAFEIEGPNAEIEIVRDAQAVPHIFAKTEYDAFFGLGFVHAQDRLWQMLLRRAIVQGRVSEFAGSFAGVADMSDFLLRVDITMRSLDLYGHAQRALTHQTEETRRSLDAYAAGVNAWLDIVADEGMGGGAPELLLIDGQVERWRPEDAIAAFKMLAANLMGSPFHEIRRTRYLIRQGPERVEDLFPEAPGGAVTALPPFAALFGDDVEFAAAERGREAAFDWPHGLDAGDFRGASNAWAVDGSRSATRAPLLASDPHLPLSAPSVWYLARIQFPDGGAIGGTIAGIPSVLAGRNEHIAWGPTTLYSDTADFYMETVNPDDPATYKIADGWAPFQTRDERITKSDGSVVEVTMRRTRHGPVLPLDWTALAEITPQGSAPALSWTLLSDEDRSLSAAMRLMRATSLDDAERLAGDYVAPPQLITIADAERVGIFAVGQAPLRRSESRVQGRVASPGWRAENDWVGVVSSSALPRSIDPPSGVVANANNRVTDAPFPNHLGFEWPAPYRMNRLADLLNNREYHTADSFRAIQNDVVSEMARGVLPLIARPLWAAVGQESGQRRAALDRLAAWNGGMDALSPEPLIFNAWLRALTTRLTADDLDELAADFAGIRPLFVERVYRDIDGAAGRWCDDRDTPAPETCDDIASLALDDALAELTEKYGEDLARWRWGEAHMAVHRHQPFGQTPLGLLFNIVHETGGGDHTLLRGQMPGDGDEPYRNVHAGGYRAIYDFADLDRSVAAIATGQSGHFLSRHYDDLAETWRTGDFIPLSLARRDAETGAVGVTRITPAQ